MIVISENWYKILKDEFNKEYFLKLNSFLKEEYKNYTVYPKTENIFNALNNVDYDDIKVVIIGQDPYHEPNQAHGLAFSVEKDTNIPPSLINIYKELNADLNCYIPNNGNLTKWAKQGVLLLNTVLTVRKGEANSHKDKGWENFTKKIIELINLHDKPVVFLLWGNSAKSLRSYITNPKHLILSSSHPSPLSAYNGFFGCKHFSKTNEFLLKNNLKPIDWQIENI